MYSEEIEKYLRKKRIKIGDRVRIRKNGQSFEGILMPRIEMGDINSLVIKLNNGYNIGIEYEKGTEIKKISSGKSIKYKPAKISLKKDQDKPTVSILGCGGTIASRVEYRTGAVFPAFSPGDFILAFPELREIANLEGRKLFSIFSEDMTPQHWKVTAEEIAKEIKKRINGIVVMHGTDTMHYTSAALSFMLQDLPVPVVLVGTQRSSDRGSSDNAMNLLCSVLTAAKSDIAQVTICMHGSMSDDFCYVHSGCKVRKLHTSRRDTFRSVNVLPYAKVLYKERKIEYLRNDFLKVGKRKLKLDTETNTNVGLIWIHPGIKSEFIESLARFYDGIVIAGTGLGHVPTNMVDKFTKPILPALKNLINSGIPIAIAPQTIYGRLQMNIYSTGRDLQEIGVIGNNCDWLPEVCLVKLMWVLGHTKNMNKVKEMMLKNYAGEISERTGVDTFLI